MTINSYPSGFLVKIFDQRLNFVEQIEFSVLFIMNWYHKTGVTDVV